MRFGIKKKKPTEVFFCGFVFFRFFFPLVFLFVSFFDRTPPLAVMIIDQSVKKNKIQVLYRMHAKRPVSHTTIQLASLQNVQHLSLVHQIPLPLCQHLAVDHGWLSPRLWVCLPARLGFQLIQSLEPLEPFHLLGSVCCEGSFLLLLLLLLLRGGRER